MWHVAKAFDHSERTLGRWRLWVAQLADPGHLDRLIFEACGSPVRVTIPEVQGVKRRASTPERREFLLRAAAVLTLLEALGSAWGLEPPGLRSVLARLISERSGLATYASPTLRDVA